MKLKNFIIVIFIYAVSCGPENHSSEQNRPYNTPDSVSQTAPENNSSFDFENFQTLVDTYEDPERNEWQNPELVLDKLKPLNDKIIADIGAGTGYFTFRLAKQGANVIAIDIDERFLNYIDERRTELPDDIRNHIAIRLSEENDPLLSPAEVDGVLMVNTYFFLANRIEYLKKVRNGLKSGGKMIIVDYKKGKIPVGPQDVNKISESKTIEELKDAGFNEVQIDNEGLQYQYIITAIKN